MSTSSYRKCAKCGVNRINNPSVKMHRFPVLGKNNHNLTQLQSWAIFCYPDKDWSDIEDLMKLHKSNKVLCDQHFQDAAFTATDRKRLIKYAVPYSENDQVPLVGTSGITRSAPIPMNEDNNPVAETSAITHTAPIPIQKGSHQALHKFPNPGTDKKRFNEWLYAVSGDILGLSDEYIYKQRRICHAHFEVKFQYGSKRLSPIAKPTLKLPASTVDHNYASKKNNSSDHNYCQQYTQQNIPDLTQLKFKETEPLVRMTQDDNKRKIELDMRIENAENEPPAKRKKDNYNDEEDLPIDKNVSETSKETIKSMTRNLTTKSDHKTSKRFKETTESDKETTESDNETAESDNETIETDNETAESNKEPTETYNDITEKYNETTENYNETAECNKETTERHNETTESYNETTEIYNETTESNNETTEGNLLTVDGEISQPTFLLVNDLFDALDNEIKEDPLNNEFYEADTRDPEYVMEEVLTSVQNESENYSLCHGCLSIDRRCQPVTDDIDILAKLLDCTFTDERVFAACWECRAALRRARCFRQRALRAAALLSQCETEGTPFVLPQTNQSSISIGAHEILDLSNYLNTDNCHEKFTQTDAVINNTECSFDGNNDDAVTKNDEFVPDNDDFVPDNDDFVPDNDDFVPENDDFVPENDDIMSNYSSDSEPELDNYTERRTNRQTMLIRHHTYKVLRLGPDSYKEHMTVIPVSIEEVKRCVEAEERLMDRDKPHRCKACCVAYKSSADLETHRKKEHGQEGATHQCSLCKDHFSKVALAAHMREHVFVYKCDVCKRNCASEKRHRLHFETQHQQIYECTYCQLLFGSPPALTRHFLALHYTFECAHCGVQYMARDPLERHMRRVQHVLLLKIHR